jgi:hypothetical protein
VGEADTGVDEENGKTGQGEEPVEDHTSALCQVDESQATEQQLQDDHVDGAAFLVDLSQELGSHACDLWLASQRTWDSCGGLTICSKSLDCASRAVSAGVGNAHDCDQDDGVEDRRQDLDTCKLDGNDERRSTRSATLSGVQRAVRRHVQSNEEQVDNVKDGDTPDDLFRGLRDLLDGVLRLRCGETDQFGTSVSEGGVDKDAAEAVEAVQEGGVRCVPVSNCQQSHLICVRRVLPVSCANVASVVGWDTSAVGDDSKDHEP